jgi:hypothetical protein
MLSFTHPSGTSGTLTVMEPEFGLTLFAIENESSALGFTSSRLKALFPTISRHADVQNPKLTYRQAVLGR